VVKHTVRLEYMSVDGFNLDDQMVLSFRETVGALLMLGVEQIQHVRACPVDSTEASCLPLHQHGNGRRLPWSAEDKCLIRYEVSCDTKEQSETVAQEIASDRYQNSATFTNGLKGAMLNNGVGLVDSNIQAKPTAVGTAGGNGGAADDGGGSNSGGSNSTTIQGGKDSKENNEERETATGVILGVFGCILVLAVVLGVVGFRAMKKKKKKNRTKSVDVRRDQLNGLRNMAHHLHTGGQGQMIAAAAVPMQSMRPMQPMQPMNAAGSAVGIQMVGIPRYNNNRSLFDNAQEEARIVRMQTRTPVAVAVPAPISLNGPAPTVARYIYSCSACGASTKDRCICR
jgi:hypothetical protein